jgi:hypothetical protein
MNAEDPKTDREWLIRIDGKLDGILVCQKDHEDRLRSLESLRFSMLGVAAFFGLIGSKVWQFMQGGN